MTIPFYKYQGTGNDFILIDQITDPDKLVEQDPELIQRLCHRQLGIGADGIIFLQKHPAYDFEMVYYNPDASKSFCGNGSRCAVHLASQLKIIGDRTQFVAIDGPHTAYMQDNIITISMRDVAAIQRMGSDYWLDIGSPHYVRLVEEVYSLDLPKLGQEINNLPPFQNTGTNVNFVQFTKIQPTTMLSVRTYERGVNAETLSCGTGVVAAALVASTHGAMSPVCIKTRGGVLKVSFSKDKDAFTDIFLIGPATCVFQGQITI
jgi:diaminopimelate epimerase